MKRGIVIGSGIAGMSAALMLTEAGIETSLIEGRPCLAPLLRGFDRQGVHFETGFHFAGGLAQGGLLNTWLKVLGLDLPYGRGLPEHEIFCLDKRRFSLPCGREALLAWTRNCFPASLAGMETLLDEMSRKMQESPYTSPLQEEKKSLFTSADCETVTEHLSGLPLDEDLKAILHTRCLLYGAVPDEALWSEYALVSGAYFFSSSTLPGGGECFLRAWEKALLKKGVRLECGKAAVRVLLAEKEKKFSVSGVELADKSVLEADYVIFTGSPAQLPEILPREAFRPAYFRHIETMPETPAPFAVYGIADNSIPENTCWYKVPQSHHFYAIEEHDPTLTIMTGPCLADGRKSCLVLGIHQAPVGIHCKKPESSRYTTAKSLLTLKLAAEAENILPELKGHWIIAEASSSWTMRRWIYGSTGSIYGCAHTKTSLPLSPATRVQGLFLAGQNILLPGMLGCIISAAIAVDFATGRNCILDRFRTCANEE